MPRTTAGYVYLIRLGEFHKIGSSRNPTQRFLSFAKLPYESTLVHRIASENALQIERALQRRFAGVWVRGEWFALTEADVARLKELVRIDATADLPSDLQPPLRVPRAKQLPRDTANLNIWIRSDIGSALRQLLASTRPRTTKSAIVETAIEDLLQQNGFWPRS